MKRLFLPGLAIVLLAAAFYLFDTTLRAQMLAPADRVLATRAKLTANTIDHTPQRRMSKTFVLSVQPSLRGFAASDDAVRPVRAAVAQAKLRAIAVHDSTIRPASILDTADGVVPKTDVRLQVSHTAPTPPLLPSMIQACSYSHPIVILYSSYSDPILILYSSITAPSILFHHPPTVPPWIGHP